jgi:hypothetical protein
MSDKRICEECGKLCSVNNDGTLHAHGYGTHRGRCPESPVRCPICGMRYPGTEMTEDGWCKGCDDDARYCDR